MRILNASIQAISIFDLRLDLAFGFNLDRKGSSRATSNLQHLSFGFAVAALDVVVGVFRAKLLPQWCDVIDLLECIRAWLDSLGTAGQTQSGR